MNKKSIEVFIKLFSNPPKVWVLFYKDPSENDYVWYFVGLYATKKALLKKKKEIKERLFWPNDCFKINQEEIHF